MAYNGEVCDPLHCFLKFPNKPGDSWDVWPEIDGQSLVCTVGKVGASESPCRDLRRHTP